MDVKGQRISLYTYTDTQAHTMHFCKEKRQRKGDRETAYSETIICHWTFTDTKPGIKKNHNTIKTLL